MSFRKRPSTSSSDDDSDDPNLPPHLLLGTPLDPTERLYRRTARLKAQDSRRKADAAASADAFTPQPFHSSRTKRAAPRDVRVEEYRDALDEEAERRAELQVRTDIEGGAPRKPRARNDPLLQSLEPRHESIAMRMLRRMRLGSAVQRRERVQERRPKGPVKRRVYSAALPPSMQAMMEEDAEEEKHISLRPAPSFVARGEVKEEAGDGAEDEGPLSPLPDIPLFASSSKADRSGLGYDPLQHADEFRDHRQRERDRRKAAEEADADADADVELLGWSTAPPAGGREGKARPQRRQRLPGFLSMVDDDDDDVVDVYDDRAEYDDAIGRTKAERRRQKAEEEEVAEARAAAKEEPLTFVKATTATLQPPSYPPIIVPPDWDERKRWDDREDVEARARMKDIVREFADKTRRDREAREQQRRAMLRAKDDERGPRDDEKVASLPAGSAPLRALPMPPPPPPLPQPLSTPAAPPSTAEMLASGFFSRFTTSSDTPTAPSSSPSLPPPTAPASPAPAPTRGEFREYGPGTREVLPWQPDKLLCKRLGIEMPIVDLPNSQRPHNVASSNARSSTSGARRARTTRALPDPALEAALEAELHAPPVVVDRPPPAVFKAIFDEDGPVQPPAPAVQSPPAPPPSAGDAMDEAMRLLSSIAPPAAPAPSPAASFVHPSRLHLVPAAAPSVGMSTGRGEKVRARPSRWGEKPAGSSMQTTAPAPVWTAAAAPQAGPVASSVRPLLPVVDPPSQLSPSPSLPLVKAAPPLSNAASFPSPAIPSSSPQAPTSSDSSSLKASLVAELARLQELSSAEKARKKERKKERKERRKSSSSHRKHRKEHRKRESSSRTEVVEVGSSDSSSSIELRDVVDLT